MTAKPFVLDLTSEADASGAETLRVVTIGHVDHGKSTMVGRLLNDCDALPDGKVEELRVTSERRGMPFEWAFLTDALKSERDQGITIDVSEVLLKQTDRNFLLIDTPGHREFIRNMLTGAARADAALMLVDVTEGVQQQTRLHAYLVQLLGLHNIVIAVNKMDLVDFSPETFERVRSDCMGYFASLGLQPAAVVPVCGRDGDNLVNRSVRMTWYKGQTVMGALSQMAAAPHPIERPLRIPVQGVYKFDSRRIVAGEVRSGRVAVGDVLHFSPSGKVARVKTIETWSRSDGQVEAMAGESVGLTLDEQIFIERGEIASHEARSPAVSNTIRVRLFWLDKAPLERGDLLDISIATRAIPGLVHEIRSVTVSDSMTAKEDGIEGFTLDRYDVGDVVIRTRGLVAVDPFSLAPACGAL